MLCFVDSLEPFLVEFCVQVPSLEEMSLMIWKNYTQNYIRTTKISVFQRYVPICLFDEKMHSCPIFLYNLGINNHKTPHSVEISGFFCHSDFTWNQFWSFLSTKIAILTILDLEVLTFSRVKFSQKSKFKVSSSVITAVFNFQKSAKIDFT